MATTTDEKKAEAKAEKVAEGVDVKVDSMTPQGSSVSTSSTSIESIPIIPYSRPSPQKSSSETGSVIVAKELAGQLGSDPRHLGQQLIDERKLAVLNEYTATALGYFAYRGDVDKQRFWNHIVGWELVSSQAIDGRGRRDILTALANTSGIQTHEVARKPDILSRNITKRDWKQKAEASGKTVVED